MDTFRERVTEPNDTRKVLKITIIMHVERCLLFVAITRNESLYSLSYITIGLSNSLSSGTEQAGL